MFLSSLLTSTSRLQLLAQAGAAEAPTILSLPMTTSRRWNRPAEKKLSDVWVLPTHAGKRTLSGELKPGVRNALTWGLPDAILEDMSSNMDTTMTQTSCGDRRPTRRTTKMSATK